ncbi:MAG TPA: wax ester/triacylglycerol synthase domain-containing protein [Dermatophilaceae bacterium]|nr:wax ester/triacylglycerol synthase domain-containing protein [Dermatophilaceae bacterium]
MIIDRASANDVMSVAVDRGCVPMHLGAVLVLDPGASPSVPALEQVLRERVPRVPRLHRRLVRTPLGCGRPVWVADRDFEVTAHLQAVELAGLAGPADADDAPVPRAVLDATADAVMARLPADRPPWRVRALVDADGRVRAVVVVLHHVLADGIGGLAVLGALADGAATSPADRAGRADPPPGRQRSSSVTRPERAPSWTDLARDAWSERARALRHLPSAPRRLRGSAAELGLGRPALVPATSLLRPTGPHRRLDLVCVPLSDVHQAGRAAGGTVNDVVVAAVAGALATLACSRGERLPEVVVSVPVSGRASATTAALGNEVGVLPVRVPTAGDPAARLAAVVAETARLGADGRRGGSAALLTPAFRLLAAVGVFQRFVSAQRLVHTFETDVRGPAVPLSLAGATVTSIAPVAVNPGNVTVSFDVLSYAGELAVTVVSDPDLVPDHGVLLEALRGELRALSAR